MFPRHLSTSEPDRLAWDRSSNVDKHQRDSSERELAPGHQRGRYKCVGGGGTVKEVHCANASAHPLGSMRRVARRA